MYDEDSINIDKLLTTFDGKEYDRDRESESKGIPYVYYINKYIPESTTLNPDQMILELDSMDKRELLTKAILNDDMRIVKYLVDNGIEIYESDIDLSIRGSSSEIPVLLFHYIGADSTKSINPDYITLNTKSDTIIYLIKDEGFKYNAHVLEALINNDVYDAVEYILGDYTGRKFVMRIIPLSRKMTELLLNNGYTLEDFHIQEIVKTSKIEVMEILVEKGLKINYRKLLEVAKLNPHGMEYFIEALLEAEK